jgi:putative membrane protein
MKKHLLFAACSLAAALVLVPDGASAQVTDTTKKDTSAVRPAPPANQDRSQAARPAGAISDSAIIAMLQVSHTQQIAAADEALQRAQSDRVKRFAETLKNDHTKALAELDQFSQRMGAGIPGAVKTDSAAKVTQPDSVAQKPAEAPPAVPADSGSGVTGHEFDHGFVRLQVEHHETEINHLRNDVIPMIKDSDLKSLVQRQLPILGRHLTTARELEAFLKTTN